ncbi:MAG: hypothetical protein K9G11_03340 [Rickettsiaceae bacterium]|nr:hypothetical protein [Rickettsiaceae bacterium]
MEYYNRNLFLKISSNFSELEEISIHDAQLLFNLRSKRKNNFLNSIYGGVQEQAEYITKYLNNKNIDEEIYYRIKDKSSLVIGFVRITKLNYKDIFSWESYILEEGVNPIIAYDVMLIIFKIGFQYLHKKKCGPWMVKKIAHNIMKFHKNVGMAKVIKEDENEILMQVLASDYNKNISYFEKRKIGIIRSFND